MFKSVHHVHFVVNNRDEMVAYIENNFGMKPEKLEVHEERGMKDALYHAGETLIEITEPMDPESGIAKHLAEHGPGVYHVAWTVDDVRGKAQELLAAGNKMRGEAGITESPRGYTTSNIDPASSLGVWFQLAEG